MKSPKTLLYMIHTYSSIVHNVYSFIKFTTQHSGIIFEKIPNVHNVYSSVFTMYHSGLIFEKSTIMEVALFA